jgi:glyceraldehyde 3-phosphate dehydrogenase
MIKLEERVGYESELNNYIKRESAAVKLINYIGRLMYDRGVELVLFRNHLLDRSISDILQLHDYAGKVVQKPIDPFTTAELAECLYNLPVKPSKLDIGKLANEWLTEGGTSMTDFLNNKLAFALGDDEPEFTPKDVVLYGFGRIGRLVARELIKAAGKGQQLRLRAVVVRDKKPEDLYKRAALLRNDSVHGHFPGTVIEDLPNQSLIVNGQIIKFINAANPEDIDYEEYGISDALVIDNTGVFKNREELGRHLNSKGVSKVLLTAPGKGIPNVVYGINQKHLDIDKEQIFSAASCTTNAICPILKVIEDEFGIEKGHIETVHAYTNDQNLLDNMHSKPRRGRSAAINMVITSTGAGEAITAVLPHLKDLFTANAVRVPTPNGSLAILNLQLKKETSVEEVNAKLKKAALEGDLVNQINYAIDPELVSSDIIGNTCCSVVDSNATLVSPDKRNAVIYTWYDNEFGYTKQVIRLAKHIARVRRLIYY